MNPNLKVSGIVALGVLISMVLPHIIILTTSKTLETEKAVVPVNSTATQVQKSETAIVMNEKKEEPINTEEEPKEEPKEETTEGKTEEVPAAVEEKTVEIKKEEKIEEPQVQEQAPTKSYGEMTTDELINAITSGTYKLEYSSSYDTGANKLTKSKGVVNYNNHRETYYSQRVLPGSSLNIPGRHVADDGTVRDGEGYICVAASTSYLSKGSIVKTSLGPAKVYDSGCASGTIDIYTNW